MRQRQRLRVDRAPGPALRGRTGSRAAAPSGYHAGPMSFAAYLRRCLLLRGGSPAALARAIGVSPTRMSRALNDRIPGFRPETVLRLAAVCETDPIDALRHARCEELAMLLEHAFRAPTIPAGRVGATVRAYLALDRERQATVDRLVADLARFAAREAVVADVNDDGRRPAVKRTKRPK